MPRASRRGEFNNEFLPGNAPHVLRIAAGVPKLDSCPKPANLLVIWGFAEQRGVRQITVPACFCQLDGKLPVFWHTRSHLATPEPLASPCAACCSSFIAPLHCFLEWVPWSSACLCSKAGQTTQACLVNLKAEGLSQNGRLPDLRYCARFFERWRVGHEGERRPRIFGQQHFNDSDPRNVGANGKASELPEERKETAPPMRNVLLRIRRHIGATWVPESRLLFPTDVPLVRQASFPIHCRS